jgi:transketolase
MLAARYQVDNLHAVIDLNGAQEVGWSHTPSLKQEPLPGPSDKWNAFGWGCLEVDGHDPLELQAALAHLRSMRGRPSVLVGRTLKGKGVKLFERNPVAYHCASLSADEYRLAMEELNA